MLLSGVLLLPFIGKPFTIDDPLFLRAAEHVFVDPLHPADFEQVWNSGDRQQLSEYWLGGMLPAYVLAPVAALGSREWVAHLYQLLLLCVFLMASVSFAGRMGCDRMQAGAVGLLVASNPVTCAMAATCMPDVMAAAFAMLAMDRVMAFRENLRPGAGVAAGALLALAILCRGTTAMLILVSALLLVPGSLKRAFACLWPLGLTVLLVPAILGLNRGHGGSVTVAGAFQQLTSVRNIPRNIVAFLCFQALTGPVLLYWLLICTPTPRRRKFLAAAFALLALGLGLSAVSSSANLQQYAVPAALGICFAAAILGLLRELPHALPLALWLGSGLVAAPYVHMAAKYLLPGVPAAALLVVLHGARLQPHRFRFVTALLIAAGGISGILIVAGDATLAGSQRAAVDQLVTPRIRQGKTVWAGGQWAFLGYAQRAGARPLANTPPLPQPGDFIVVSRLDYYGKLDTLPLRLDLVNVRQDDRCGVFVMNRRFSAGFYSIRFGYLPFALGCTQLNRYDVFRVLPWSRP
jgi:Dolichyl-phosphate-mannose-protein mannosyltransferase